HRGRTSGSSHSLNNVLPRDLTHGLSLDRLPWLARNAGRVALFSSNARHIDTGRLMGTKRQTTMAKLARERKLQEKRELKREKKQAAAAAKAAGYLPGEEEMAGDMTENGMAGDMTEDGAAPAELDEASLPAE
ncbi:MAG: hypothetical protein QOH23_1233, partial [Gaiellaceae bacterium]|nr:hypothetical protein [Gaiellaceae bacterium]